MVRGTLGERRYLGHPTIARDASIGPGCVVVVHRHFIVSVVVCEGILWVQLHQATHYHADLPNVGFGVYFDSGDVSGILWLARVTAVGWMAAIEFL